MKLYKLTNENDQTYNETQWGKEVTHEAMGKGELCGPGWIHAYTDPLLAVLLNPIHGDFEAPHLWVGEGEVDKTDRGIKVGCKRFTTIRQMELPSVTTDQRVQFGILCALKVYDRHVFGAWAANWLNNANRTANAAYATNATYAANVAANAANAAYAAAYATNATYAAAYAACAADYAATAKDLDLIAIAQEAMDSDQK